MIIATNKKYKNISYEHKNYEDFIWVLDYFPYGHEQNNNDLRHTYISKPIIQAIGENYFTLLEIEPSVENIPSLTSRISLKDKKYINYIKNRINYNSLSRGSKIELPIILEKIVKMNETRYIDFFNKANPISVRMNSLELIPGIGKKLMWDIIESSKKSKFTDFEDLKKKVPGFRDPEKSIVKRIIMELEGSQKYNIFI